LWSDETAAVNVTTSPGGVAVGGAPRWRDLPPLAGIVARAYGAAPARARIVGAAWRATAGSFWLLLLAAAHARRRVRATPHAVVIMDAPAVLTGREAGLLAAVVAAMLMAVGACEGMLVALATAVGVGGGWIQWASPALLASLLLVESAPAGRRAARGWGRTARAAQELRAGGRSVATAGMLAAWPRGHGYAGELMRALTAQADQAGLDIVVDAATLELADTYGRYGWQPCSARDPLLLVRTASRWVPAAGSTRK
jgi:hypothetical protein